MAGKDSRDYKKEAGDLLRMVLTGEEVEKWFHRSNGQLGGRTPQSFIDEGRGKIIFELAHDMITGQPT